MKTIDFNKKLKARVEIWDTAGQDKLRTMVSSYYKGIDGVIIVLDATQPKTFFTIDNWIEEIKRFAKEEVIIYVAINKVDQVSEDHSLDEVLS